MSKMQWCTNTMYTPQHMHCSPNFTLGCSTNHTPGCAPNLRDESTRFCPLQTGTTLPKNCTLTRSCCNVDKQKFSVWCTGPSAWCIECTVSSANGASCTLQTALLPHCVPAPVVHIAIHPLSSPSHTPCFHIKRLALMEYCC